MKLTSTAALMALCLSGAHGAAISLDKRGSNSWAGSNLYFLHGLSGDDQAAYINTLAPYGAKVVRVWVTGLGQGCQKGSNVVRNIGDLEPSIGSYDDTVLDALDGVLSQLAAKGIKAIISPHDGNAFGYNSCDAYCSKYGDGQKSSNSGAGYYGSTEAKAAIDKRYAHILNYVSPSSGQKWGQWSDAILAFDVENEPFQQAEDKASQNDPDDWLCGRAGEMKKLLGSSGVKIATGGIGGDQSHNNNFMAKALECDAIDIMSIHGYVGTAGFWSSWLPQRLSDAESHNKLVMVEEWGVSTDYQDDFDKQAAAITAQGIPFTYWQFTDYDATDCQGSCCGAGWDGFEVGLSSGKGDAKGAIDAAKNAGAKQDWSGLLG